MITSLKNPRVAEAVKLRKRGVRDKRREFLVEGAQAVLEAVRAGAGHSAPLRELFVGPDSAAHPAVAEARHAGIAVTEVSDEVIRALTSTVTPQGLVGISTMVDSSLEELPGEISLAVVLFAVRDPGNAGTILRSADAAGAQAVVFSEASVDVYNPKVVRSSAGSVFHLPVVRDAGIEQTVGALRARGAGVYAMAASGDAELYDLDLGKPAAFVFGNEAWGLPDEVAALADATVRVPIPGAAESLNLATAAGVCLFEAVRQRTRGGGSLEDLIAGAAHDIRSPLTAVKGFVSTLARRWAALDDEQRQAMLDAIGYDVDRMNGVLRELVDASRLSSGRLELSPEPVELRDLVGKVVTMATANPDHPAVVWEGEDLTVRSDPERLRGAISAMVQAAAWWGQEGPVRIRASGSAGAVQIEVARAATEVTVAEAGALFAPRRPGEGAGTKLGLYVARGFAEAQGGTLTADVSEGFRVRLTVPEGEVPPASGRGQSGR
ncbi:MAG: TrmH family RNA methyltransferase [Actinomycetota bacterium]